MMNGTGEIEVDLPAVGHIRTDIPTAHLFD